MLRKTMIVLATAAALTGGLTADAFARGGGGGGHGGGLGGKLARRACPSGPSATLIKTPIRRMRPASCARRERPRDRRAAEERDELAPLHSITSSATNRMSRLIVNPDTCRLHDQSGCAGSAGAWSARLRRCFRGRPTDVLPLCSFTRGRFRGAYFAFSYG